MKVMVTVCFIFVFILQVSTIVAGKVRYGDRIIRQSFETAQAGQVQQPPVDIQSSTIPPDTTTLLSLNNLELANQNLQLITSTISPSNAIEHNQTQRSLHSSQIPQNQIVSPYSVSDSSNFSSIPEENLTNDKTPPSLPSSSQINPYPVGASHYIPNSATPFSIPAQIPAPYYTPSSSTPSQLPFNPITPPNNVPISFTGSGGVQNTSVQASTQMYPYNFATTSGKPTTYPSLPYLNPMLNPYPCTQQFGYNPNPYPYPYPCMQQFAYNPYYSQYQTAFMNPQMMNAVPANPMQYMPFSSIPASNCGQNTPNNLTRATSTLANPIPSSQNQTSDAIDQSNIPTVISSTGESGTDLNSLPPQVKDFIDMIPQILSMHESSPAQITSDIKNPLVRKLPKIPPRPLLRKKQYYNTNHLPSSSSDTLEYPQRYGYYY